jgi:hypothetical protein
MSLNNNNAYMFHSFSIIVRLSFMLTITKRIYEAFYLIFSQNVDRKDFLLHMDINFFINIFFDFEIEI